jgi:hypothetical protein
VTVSRKQQPPSCEHVTSVTVLPPFQVVYDGIVYPSGATVTDVLNDEAERWLLNGWAVQA